MNILRAAACSLILLSSLPSSAQEPTVTPLPTRVMTRLEQTGDLAVDPDFEKWAVSLDSSISKLESVSMVKRSVSETDPLLEAGSEFFDLLVRVSVTENRATKKATAAYKIIDVVTQKVIADRTIDGPIPDEIELSEFWWLPLTVAVDAAKPTRRTAEILIKSTPGTRFSVAGKKLFDIGETGEATMATTIPSTHAWSASHPGLKTQSGVITVLEGKTVLEIPAIPVTEWTVESGLVMLQFPDVWLGRNFLNERAFARVGFEQYIIGFYLPAAQNTDAYDSFIISFPMLLPGISCGAYFSDSSKFIRPYVKADLFMRWNLNLHKPDPVGPLLMRYVSGIDWRLNTKIKIFGELGFSWYPLSNGALMAASRGVSGDGPFGFSYNRNNFFEWPVCRFGIRRGL